MKKVYMLLMAGLSASALAVFSATAALAAPVLPNPHADPHAAKGQATAAAASANGQAHAAGHGAPGGSGGAGAANRAVVTHWTATFTTVAADGGTATWTCTGNRVVNHGHPAGLDSATCTVTGDTTGMVAGTYTGAPAGALPPNPAFTWVSPFDGKTAASWEAVVMDNGDGTFSVEVSAFF